MRLITYLLSIWRHRRLYVDLDPADSSVTLSPSLFYLIKSSMKKNGSARVLVSMVKGRRKYYGIIINPEQADDEICPPIAFSQKYHSVGFATACPTVARVLYDYRIMQYDKPVRLSARYHIKPVEHIEICRPRE